MTQASSTSASQASDPQIRDEAGDEPVSMRRLRALLAELERELATDSVRHSPEP